MSKKHTLKIGRLLLVSHGAYSSYERLSWFVVVQPFCPDDELKEYMATRPTPPKEEMGEFWGPQGRFDYNAFLAWINRKGLLAEVDEFFDEWHLGDYGKADEVAFMPASESMTGAER